MTKNGDVYFVDLKKGFDEQEIEKVDVDKLKINLGGQTRVIGQHTLFGSAQYTKSSIRISLDGGSQTKQPRFPMEIFKVSSEYIVKKCYSNIIGFLEKKNQNYYNDHFSTHKNRNNKSDEKFWNQYNKN